MIKWKCIYGLFFLFFFYTNAFSQEKLSLNVKFKPENRLTKKIKFERSFDDTLELHNEVNSIIDLLHKEGYLLAQIKSLSEKEDLLFECDIDVGKPFTWINLDIDSSDYKLVKLIEGDLDNFHYRTFKIEEFADFKEDIVFYYENNGYPFVDVGLKNTIITDTTIQAQLQIEKGVLVKTDSIRIKGDLELTEIYLRNYLSIKNKSLYDESKIKKIDKRLVELPFVRVKNPTTVLFNEGDATIDIFADSKNASRFDGILGFLPDNDNPGKILVTGDVKLNLLNSFNSGEILYFRWRKLKAETQDLKIDISYPYVFNSVFGVDLGLYMFKKDTTYLNLDRSIGLRYLFAGNDYLKVYYELQTTDVISTYQMLEIEKPPPFLDLTTNIYGIEMKYDKLDYIYNPRKGLDAKINVSVGLKEIRKNNNINEEIYKDLVLKTNRYNLKSELSYFIPLWKYNTILLKNQSGAIFNEELFENELYRIGGLHTLRGFDEESIFASHYSVFTWEFRYLFENRSNLKLFADYAYYERRINEESLVDRPWGVGAGISFDTKAGVFSLNYAIGKQFGNPIDLKTAKIHFGFVSVF